MAVRHVALHAAAPVASYLPRLTLGWASETPSATYRELDGSLVSVDLSGFTALSERLAAKGRAGTEELILVISGVFEGLIGIAGRYGGDVLKFRGDALLLFFDGGGHESRACAAASGMQWFIETAGSTMSSVGPVELRMATGVYSGPCQFFFVERSHRELVVLGPAATRTAELEDESNAGEILVSAQTASALDASRLAGERDGAYLLAREVPDTPEADWPNLAPAVDDSLLEQLVPAALRTHLTVAHGEGEHRQATVAFLKLSETDAIFEREGGGALGARLQELARIVSDACAAYGVTWLESDIDRGAGKFYLAAGAPSSTGADEEAMLRVLRAVVDAGGPLPVRAGVNRGPVFAGDIGASTRRTYAVMGDAVNLAARLCGRAETGEILATGDVLDRSAARYETERQPFLVKGKERAIHAYRVGAFTGMREEEAARLLPLVGRDGEVAALQDAVNAARMIQTRVVELAGEPGIGKSRLVEELKTLALGFNQVAAACERYAQSEPFFPWRQVLRRLAGIAPDHSREEAGAHLTQWIGTVMPDLLPWLPLLAIPFDAEVASTPEADAIDEAFRFDRLHDVAEQFLQRVLMMPTLLVFEDAHWMDDASRFLLTHLTSKAAPRPWLVCVTSRPEGATVVGPETPGTRLVLEPLSDEAAAELALTAAEEAAVSAETLGTLATRSGGNPLFVRELVAASRQGGSLDSLPETVETLMTTRIDMLDVEDRMLLRYAAVVGPRFELSLLGEILADEMADPAALDRWARLGEFVAWEGTEMLVFRHDLVRATAYEGLSFQRRRAIHGRLAYVLERDAGDRVDEAASLLSLHFLEAEKYEKAWRYAVTAAEQARSKYANVVAAELYERALDAASHLPAHAREDVLAVWEALGDVSILSANFERAETAYGHALELAAADVIARTRLIRKLGVSVERLGRREEAVEWFERGLAELDASPVSDGGLRNRVELEIAYAGTLYYQSRFDDCIRRGEAAARDAETAGDKSALAHAYYLLGLACAQSGRPPQGYQERAIEIYEETGELVGYGTLLNNLGLEAYETYRWDEALEHYARAVDLSGRAGDVVSVARVHVNEADVLADRGHLEAAEAKLREAMRVWRAANYPLAIAITSSNLGRVVGRAGRFEEAKELLAGARDAFVELGNRLWAAEASARIADVHVLAGEYQEALQLADATSGEAPALGASPALLALIERVAGYALAQARRPDEARPRFERSAQIARDGDAQFELALTLKAMADSRLAGADAAAESAEILSRLGVLSVPEPPLP